ncbi:MAG: hypothetical protein QM731_21200 [Chitinophagaceae bacterium]
MKYFVLFILCGVTLTACFKDNTIPSYDGTSCAGECYVLAGRITEKQSGNGLAGVELKFYFKPAGYAIIDNRDYLGVARTGTDGSYSFSFPGKKYRSPQGYFIMQGSKEGYIYFNTGSTEIMTFLLDSTRLNSPVVNNIALYKASTLKINVKTDSITNFNFLTVTYSYGNGGYGQALNGGAPINQTLTYKTAADMPTFIQWNAYGNGVSISRKDTIVVPSGTEKVYDIKL